MPPKSNILIMGVSGSGKTTIARLLSQKLNYEFLEADEFHPKENIEKMSRGEPLNDEDRRPWLLKISKALNENEEKGAILACSALKNSYREILQNGLQNPLLVFYLEGSFEQIFERMSKRKNHFMPKSLLKNQFETLEIPKNAIRINIENSPEIITEIIFGKIKKQMKDIGILGLGVMGKSLALNFSNKGFGVAVYNIPMPGEEKVVENFVQNNSNHSFFGGESIPDFLNNLESPRKVLLMVKSGAPVDSVIQKLTPHLEKGDIIIDGGNSFFKDTIRRQKELENIGIHYVGMGVSGGEKGALLGPSMMPAGSLKIKNELMPLFEKVAAQKDREPCVSWIGENGSGHFVKMIHNGIEYADMQILSEGYSILKNGCGQSNDEIAETLTKWKNGFHDSYLLDITVEILKYKEDGKPILDQILDVAGHKGTGLWTVKEGLELGVPIPSISAAMNARILSGQKNLRVRLAKNLAKSSIQKKDIDLIKSQISDGILVARFFALAEGFHLMKVAAKKYNWNLNLSEIAKIWRGGCIIRSKMLPLIADIFEKENEIEHLFESSQFQKSIGNQVQSLQLLESIISLQNIATPCISAALQYYKSLHEGYSAINLIQAQRDYFGAHTYRKLNGGNESFHTNWE